MEQWEWQAPRIRGQWNGVCRLLRMQLCCGLGWTLDCRRPAWIETAPSLVICHPCLVPRMGSRIISGHIFVCSKKGKKNIVWSLETRSTFLKSLQLIYLDVFSLLTSLKVSGSSWASRAPCWPPPPFRTFRVSASRLVCVLGPSWDHPSSSALFFLLF